MFGDGPSLTMIWLGFLGLGAIGFLLSLVRWWASIPILVLLALWAAILLEDLYAADLYPIYMRTRPDFVTSATVAIFVGLLIPIIGVVTKLSRRLKTATPPN